MLSPLSAQRLKRDVERCCSWQRAMKRTISDFANLTIRERPRNGVCKKGRNHGLDDVIKLEQKLSTYFSEALE